MQLYNQISLKENDLMYNYLKINSQYFKYFSRDIINYNSFAKEMKKKYKIRVTDKIYDAIDNAQFISSILNEFK